MIKIKPIKRKNPHHRNEPAKYYLTPLCEGEASMEDLCHLIAQRAGMDIASTQMIIEAILHEIPKQLANGNAVKLGDLGCLRLTFHSEGVEKKSQLNTNHISQVTLKFKPTPEFEHMANKLKFEQVKEDTTTR